MNENNNINSDDLSVSTSELGDNISIQENDLLDLETVNSSDLLETQIDESVNENIPDESNEIISQTFSTLTEGDYYYQFDTMIAQQVKTNNLLTIVLFVFIIIYIKSFVVNLGKKIGGIK